MYRLERMHLRLKGTKKSPGWIQQEVSVDSMMREEFVKMAHQFSSRAGTFKMTYRIDDDGYLLRNHELAELSREIDMDTDRLKVGPTYIFNNRDYTGHKITPTRLKHFSMACKGEFYGDFSNRRELFEAADSLCFVSKVAGRWECTCIRYWKTLACQHTLVQKLEDEGKSVESLTKGKPSTTRRFKELPLEYSWKPSGFEKPILL